jgi:hypothetical protein
LRSVRNWGGKTGIANKLNLPVDRSFLSYAAIDPTIRTIARSSFACPGPQGPPPAHPVVTPTSVKIMQFAGPITLFVLPTPHLPLVYFLAETPSSSASRTPSARAPSRPELLS